MIDWRDQAMLELERRRAVEAARCRGEFWWSLAWLIYFSGYLLGELGLWAWLNRKIGGAR